MLIFRINDSACVLENNKITLESFKPDKNIIISSNQLIDEPTLAFIKYNRLFRNSLTGVIVLPRCERLCKYCSNKSMIDNNPKPYLDWLEDILLKYNFDHYIITGGEPLDNLDELVFILNKINNQKVIIYTSAYKKIRQLFDILHKYKNVIVDYTIDFSTIHPVDELIELGNKFKERFLLKHSIIDTLFLNTFEKIQLNGNGFGYTVSYVLEPIDSNFDDNYKSFILKNAKNNFNSLNNENYIINKSLVYFNVNRNNDLYNILTNSFSTTYNNSKFIICKTKTIIDGNEYNHCFSTNCVSTVNNNKCRYLVKKCLTCPIYKTCCILYSSIEHYKKNELCRTMINAELINRWLYLNKIYS